MYLLREKWISILSHVYDIHEFNDNKLFKKCSHGPIQPRAWLTPGSPAHNSLKSIVMDKRLLKDLSYFVDFKHTGNIEVYHSLLLKYWPKRLHFSPHGMIARTQVAVLHFNSIINAEQACTKDRTPRFKLLFSKVSQCYVVKPIRDVPEKAYLEELVNKTIRLVESGGQSELPRIPENETKKQKPSKEEVIKFQKTRFFRKITSCILTIVHTFLVAIYYIFYRTYTFKKVDFQYLNSLNFRTSNFRAESLRNYSFRAILSLTHRPNTNNYITDVRGARIECAKFKVERKFSELRYQFLFLHLGSYADKATTLRESFT